MSYFVPTRFVWRFGGRQVRRGRRLPRWSARPRADAAAAGHRGAAQRVGIARVQPSTMEARPVASSRHFAATLAIRVSTVRAGRHARERRSRWRAPCSCRCICAAASPDGWRRCPCLPLRGRPRSSPSWCTSRQGARAQCSAGGERAVLIIASNVAGAGHIGLQRGRRAARRAWCGSRDTWAKRWYLQGARPAGTTNTSSSSTASGGMTRRRPSCRTL